MAKRLEQLIGWFERWFEHRWFAAHVALIGMAMGVPSLWLGWQTDDLFHGAGFVKLEQFPPVWDPIWNMFSFVSGRDGENRRLVDEGLLPWWAPDHLRLSFFRPLTALTHWLDYTLWPSSAWLMHLQSLLWYGALVAVVAMLFRQLQGTTRSAGLAALLFAFDDGHALPVSWLANRNSIIAALFGALCLISYHRWRQCGFRWGVIAAPLLLGASVLSAEAGVGTPAFLFAYALFLDPARLRQRMLALLPCVAVGALWWAFYHQAGYGAFGSDVYIDPARSPLRFLMAVMARLPLLIWGQFSFPPSDLSLMLSSDATTVFRWIAVLFSGLLLILLKPWLVRDARARFWLSGMLLAMLPICATFSSDRLLMVAGIGGMGFVGRFLGSWRTAPTPAHTRRWLRYGARSCCWLFLGVHLIIAPLNFLPNAYGVKIMGSMVGRASASLPHDADVVDDQVFILSTPSAYMSLFAATYQALNGRPTPRRTRVLGASVAGATLRRVDERTIAIRPDGGFLLSPGTCPRGLASWAGLRNAMPLFDRLFWSPADPFRAGRRIALTGLSVLVATVTPDGRPDSVQFRFDKPLEDQAYRWVMWDGGVYTPVELPAVGQSSRLSPPWLPGD
ncbi:MAG: hypothetical protein ACE5E5_06465 [Phycisphaerae bacterium]